MSIWGKPVVLGGTGGASILSGTSAPSSAQGANGDVYLQLLDGNEVGLVPVLIGENGCTISDGSLDPANFPAWKAFNGSNSGITDSWVSGHGANSAYIGYNFARQVTVRKVSVTNRDEAGAARAVKTFKLQGSNDGGSSWTDIQAFSISDDGAGVTSTFALTTAATYSAFRILITDVWDSVAVGVGKLQFYKTWPSGTDVITKVYRKGSGSWVEQETT